MCNNKIFWGLNGLKMGKGCKISKKCQFFAFCQKKCQLVVFSLIKSWFCIFLFFLDSGDQSTPSPIHPLEHICLRRQLLILSHTNFLHLINYLHYYSLIFFSIVPLFSSFVLTFFFYSSVFLHCSADSWRLYRFCWKI